MNRLYGSEPLAASVKPKPGWQHAPWQDYPQDDDIPSVQKVAQGGRIYDTRKYFKPGGLVEPGVTHYGKQQYYFYDKNNTQKPHRVSGQKMIDGKVVESIDTRFKLKKDAIAAAKEFQTKVKDIVVPYRTVEGRIPKGKLTLLNKYSQLFYEKDFAELTDEKKIWKVQNRAKKGKFVKKTMFDRFSPENEEKITKAFSDEFKIDFDNKGRYGVDRYLPGTKTANPEYTAIRNFVEKGYRKTVKDLLSASDQRKVMNNFELPEGVKEWNFKKYIYGIPDTGSTNRNLGKRIANNLAEKKDWVVAADWATPKGWMLGSMHRAWKNKVILPNGQLAYEPKWETINGKKRIVGFTDNTTYGHGKTYYGLKKWNTIHKGTNWANHADFKSASKFVSIAKKSYAQPNEVIMKLLEKKGVARDGRLTLNHVLNFLAKQEGKATVERAIVKHHRGGVGAKDALRARATNDIQLLTNTVNNEVTKIENRVLKNNKILPADIAELKKLEASIRGPDGRLYGGGSRTASGGLKMIERQAVEKIKKWEPATVKKFENYIKAIGCPGLAAGGRVGFAETGSANCFNLGREKIRTGQIKAGAEESNFKKLIKAAKGARGVARVTGLGLAWEAAFAPIIVGWMGSEGESWERMKHELAYGPILEGLGVPAKYVPGESAEEELKKYIGNDAYDLSKIHEISGRYQFLPTAWDPSGAHTRFDYTPGRLDYLKMELDREINRGGKIGGKPGRKTYKQFQIEKEIQKYQDEAQNRFSTFMRRIPHGEFADTEKYHAAEKELDKGRVALEADKATRKEEGFGGIFSGKLDPTEEMLGLQAGGRVGFKLGGIDKGRRAFMKWLAGLTGAGIAAGTGLLKFGKTIGKGKTVIKAGDHIIQGTEGMPNWFIPLVNRIVKEGDDVTAKLGTVEREIVHTKKISAGEEVTVYNNLDTGNVRVEYNSPNIMGEGVAGPVQLEYRAGEVITEGKHAGKKTKPEFEAMESEPVGHTHGPDDYSIEWDGEYVVGRVEDLTSDTSKLKEFGTKKNLTHRDKVIAKKKQKAVQKVHENESDYIVSRQGEGEWDDYLPDIDDLD